MVSRLRNLSRDSLAPLERVNSRAILYIGGLTDRSEVLLAFYVVTPGNSSRIAQMIRNFLDLSKLNMDSSNQKREGSKESA
jgi:hypothetical protein